MHDAVTPSSLSRVLDSLAASTGIEIDRTLAGETIGEYHLVTRIGEGGMGSVYGAIHPLIGKRVAIKVMHKNLGDHAVERFLREARAVARTAHPNIVDIFAFGTLPDGRGYYVMEWLAGQTLLERARTPMTLGEVVAIIDSIARALQAAHVAQVVHRDLKPENVFLAEVPGEPVRAKLLDFGIAKLTDEIDQTSTGIVLGTPLYVSPEQARGLRVDVRSDVYSLGVMMFELMAGTLPFVSPSAYDLLSQHVSATPPDASEFHPGLPAPLCALLAEMLAKDPWDRPTLATVRATIARFANDRSQPMTWAPRAVTRVRARGSVAPGTRPLTGTSGQAHVLVEEESGVLVAPPIAVLPPPEPAPRAGSWLARGMVLAMLMGIGAAALGSSVRSVRRAPQEVAPLVVPASSESFEVAAREARLEAAPPPSRPAAQRTRKRAPADRMIIQSNEPAEPAKPLVKPAPAPRATIRDPFASEVHDPFASPK